MSNNSRIDTSNNISLHHNNNDFGIKNYFLEAQKKAQEIGDNVKKKLPPTWFADSLKEASASTNAGFALPWNANPLGTTNK